MNGLVVETHELISLGSCDVITTCSDEGEVWVELKASNGFAVGMDWDDFREIIDFVAVHGLGMKQPYVVEYDEIKEGAHSK